MHALSVVAVNFSPLGEWLRGVASAQDSFVNIGAKDGGEEDPLHALLLDKAAVRFALAVEMNPEIFGMDWKSSILSTTPKELLPATMQRVYFTPLFCGVMVE